MRAVVFFYFRIKSGYGGQPKHTESKSVHVFCYMGVMGVVRMFVGDIFNFANANMFTIHTTQLLRRWDGKLSGQTCLGAFRILKLVNYLYTSCFFALQMLCRVRSKMSESLVPASHRNRVSFYSIILVVVSYGLENSYRSSSISSFFLIFIPYSSQLSKSFKTFKSWPLLHSELIKKYN